jgi:hypothetical protein
MSNWYWYIAMLCRIFPSSQCNAKKKKVRGLSFPFHSIHG